MVSSEVLIKAHRLTKKFGSFTAVNYIDFEVYKGECVGFLGSNGAGKLVCCGQPMELVKDD